MHFCPPGITLAFRFMATVSPFRFAVFSWSSIICYPCRGFRGSAVVVYYRTCIISVATKGGLDQKMIEGLERAFSSRGDKIQVEHLLTKWYLDEGETIEISSGVVELLELVAILLFWFFDTPSKIGTGLFYPCLSQYFTPTPSKQ